jgi:Arc/MetJ family transcription regulator
VIRGVMPTKAQILKAARTAVRRHLRKLAKDRKERALLEAAGAYAGTTFEIEEKS